MTFQTYVLKWEFTDIVSFFHIYTSELHYNDVYGYIVCFIDYWGSYRYQIAYGGGQAGQGGQGGRGQPGQLRMMSRPGNRASKSNAILQEDAPPKAQPRKDFPESWIFQDFRVGYIIF